MLAESQALQRVRHVAKAPANPFPLVYETQHDACQAKTLCQNTPARDGQTSYGINLSDRALTVRPQRRKEHQAHPIPLIASPRVRMQIFHPLHRLRDFDPVFAGA